VEQLFIIKELRRSEEVLYGPTTTYTVSQKTRKLSGLKDCKVD